MTGELSFGWKALLLTERVSAAEVLLSKLVARKLKMARNARDGFGRFLGWRVETRKAGSKEKYRPASGYFQLPSSADDFVRLYRQKYPDQECRVLPVSK